MFNKPRTNRISQTLNLLAIIPSLLAIPSLPLQAQQPSQPSATPRPELHLQIGHSQQVNEVLLSPDGKLVASTGYDLGVKIWDALTGDLKLTITGSELLIGKRTFVTWSRFEFTADSRAIRVRFRVGDEEATSKAPEPVVVYDLQTGKSIPDPDKASGLCPVDEELVVASPDGGAALCVKVQIANLLQLRSKSRADAVPLAENFEPYSHQSVFSPDGKTVIVSGKGEDQDDTVKLWDVATGKLLREIGERLFVGFLDNGQTIALYRKPVDQCNCNIVRLTEAEKNGAVELWDARLRTVKHNLPGRTVAAVSPDGKTLVLWHSQKDAPSLIEFWDVQLGVVKGKRTDEEHSPVFSPDGKIVAFKREKDNVIVLCDGRTGATKHELGGHQVRFATMQFAADSATLTIADDAGLVSLWDAQTGALKIRLDGAQALKLNQPNKTTPSPPSSNQKAPPPDFAFFTASSDGRMVAARLNVSVVIWNLRAGSVTRTISGGPAEICVWLLNDGRKIVQTGGAGGYDVNLPALLWDLNTLRPELAPKQENNDESRTFIAPDGRTKVVVNDGLKAARLYDAKTGQERQTLSGHTGLIGNVLFSPDGKTIATVSGLPEDKLWGAYIALLRVFSNDKKEEGKAAPPSLSHDKTIRLWDAQTGKLNLTLECAGEIHNALFSPDGSKLIALTEAEGERSSETNVAQVWDAQTGKVIRTIKGSKGINSVALSPDGLVTLSVEQDGGLKAWETLSGAVKWKWTLPVISGNPSDGLSLSMSFSPDGKIIVTETSNYLRSESEAKLWDAQTGQPLNALKDFRGFRSFAPDSKTIIGQTSDEITFWDVASGARKWSLPSKGVAMGGDCLTPDGKLAVGAGAKGAINIHDAQTGRLLVTLTAFFNRDDVTALPDWIAFTPEGYYSASPGAARYIRWRVGDKLLPAANYAQEFNRPDLVQQALR